MPFHGPITAIVMLAAGLPARAHAVAGPVTPKVDVTHLWAPDFDAPSHNSLLWVYEDRPALARRL